MCKVPFRSRTATRSQVPQVLVLPDPSSTEAVMKVRWRFVTFWVLLFTFWYTAPTEGESKAITIGVTPKISIAPLGKRGNVRATWRIEPSEDNAHYSFAYSGTEEGSTLRSMDEFSPIHYERLLELPSGQYIFRACVVRNERPKPKTYCAEAEAEIR